MFFFGGGRSGASALGEGDGGDPVVHAVALLAEQAQLVQGRVLPWLCTGALHGGRVRTLESITVTITWDKQQC